MTPALLLGLTLDGQICIDRGQMSVTRHELADRREDADLETTRGYCKHGAAAPALSPRPEGDDVGPAVRQAMMSGNI